MGPLISKWGVRSREMYHIKKKAQRSTCGMAAHTLAKQALQVNRSKQMADPEKMKEIDFSHCAGEYSFFFQMQRI